jgi:AcrR family transcriptional regulator
MTRLAQDRDTHMTPQEIAAEALKQFDAGGSEPSIRTLATALRVAPTAIYHHFPSRAEIVQAAIELVWQEAMVEGLRNMPDPTAADPLDVLVAGGRAVRRTFDRHYQIAPYLAATPEPNPALDDVFALVGYQFERLGLDREHAVAACHAYATFALGSILFAANRRIANEQLEGGRGAERFHSGTVLDEVVDLSVVAPERDVELYAQGLRKLITAFISTPE